MRLLRWIDRLLSHPAALKVLAPLTVIALAAAAFAVFGVLANDAQREQDRVSSDMASCTRGNLLRSQVRDIGAADQAMIQNILDVVLPANRDQRAADMRSQLEPILAEHERAVAQIKLVDCQELVPGASTTTPGGKP